MEDKALAYFDLEGIGKYALTPKITDKYPEPKHFLVKMSEETAKKHEKDFIPNRVDCTYTKTGARFCVIWTERLKVREIVAMEMVRPIYEMSVMVKEHRIPTMEEARKLGKNDFLVIKIKPEDFGRTEHVT